MHYDDYPVIFRHPRAIFPVMLLIGFAAAACSSAGGMRCASGDDCFAGETCVSSLCTVVSEGEPDAQVGDVQNTDPDGIEGISLMQKLPGLWMGDVTQMFLDSFPPMYMDIRPVDEGRQLMSRNDVDLENNLRFGFLIETHAGEDVLVFRYGGQFLGAVQDSRAGLVEYDSTEERWHFCAVAGGCADLDATISFGDDENVVFDLKVDGSSHLHWSARRVEHRTVEAPFPSSTESRGIGEAPWPELATLEISTTWTESLGEDSRVWAILSVTDCGFPACNYSRAVGHLASAGDTSATLIFEQLHPGPYKLTTFIDANDNKRPDSGEMASIPNKAVNVAAEGRTEASAAIDFVIP
ncbi:MAG: hypothetical protein ACNA8W_22715 [Bradymonadaceae bacterium]